MSTFDKIMDITSRQGVAISFCVVVIFLAFLFGKVFLDNYKKQQELNRDLERARAEAEAEERREDRRISQEQTNKLIDLQAKTTETIASFGYALQTSDKILTDHDKMSSEKFECIDTRFDSVDEQFDELKDQVSTLAPKEDLYKVMENIEELRRSLKKDYGVS